MKWIISNTKMNKPVTRWYLVCSLQDSAVFDSRNFDPVLDTLRHNLVRKCSIANRCNPTLYTWFCVRLTRVGSSDYFRKQFRFSTKWPHRDWLDPRIFPSTIARVACIGRKVLRRSKTCPFVMHGKDVSFCPGCIGIFRCRNTRRPRQTRFEQPYSMFYRSQFPLYWSRRFRVTEIIGEIIFYQFERVNEEQ